MLMAFELMVSQNYDNIVALQKFGGDLMTVHSMLMGLEMGTHGAQGFGTVFYVARVLVVSREILERYFT